MADNAEPLFRRMFIGIIMRIRGVLLEVSILSLPIAALGCLRVNGHLISFKSLNNILGVLDLL